MAKVQKLTFLNVAILTTISISVFIELLDINHQGLSLAVYAILAINLLTSLFLYYKLTPTSILLKYQLLNAVKKMNYYLTINLLSIVNVMPFVAMKSLFDGRKIIIKLLSLSILSQSQNKTA